MKTVVKLELVQRIQKARPGPNQETVMGIVNEFIRQVNRAMVNRERVELRYFGSFRIHVQSYNARDPRTGKDLGIKKSTRIMFTPSICMKKRLNAKNT